MQNKIWQALKPGDEVDIIAPAGRLSVENLNKLADLLKSWQLKVNIAEDIFGDDLLCANSDAKRLQHLQSALYNPRSKAVICARGGYGAMRLMPELFRLPAPEQVKLFIGMSDITALTIFFQQQWHWATLHAALSVWRLTENSVQELKQVIFGEVKQVNFNDVKPMNSAATSAQLINSSVVGGNLCLVQCSLGTAWQLDVKDKIILLEETNERAYKIDRMLEQLYQAGIFKQAKAVLLGDFIKGEEPNGTSLIEPVLQRFAERLAIPVIQIPGIGHGDINHPIPLGTSAQLQLGVKNNLCCQFGNAN